MAESLHYSPETTIMFIGYTPIQKKKKKSLKFGGKNKGTGNFFLKYLKK